MTSNSEQLEDNEVWPAQQSSASCEATTGQYKRRKLPAWSYEEEYALAKLHSELGTAWASIAEQLPGRTASDAKNIWHSTLRSKAPVRRSLLFEYVHAVQNSRDAKSRRDAFRAAVRLHGPKKVSPCCTRLKKSNAEREPQGSTRVKQGPCDRAGDRRRCSVGMAQSDSYTDMKFSYGEGAIMGALQGSADADNSRPPNVASCTTDSPKGSSPSWGTDERTGQSVTFMAVNVNGHHPPNRASTVSCIADLTGSPSHSTLPVAAASYPDPPGSCLLAALRTPSSLATPAAAAALPTAPTNSASSLAIATPALGSLSLSIPGSSANTVWERLERRKTALQLHRTGGSAASTSATAPFHMFQAPAVPVALIRNQQNGLWPEHRALQQPLTGMGLGLGFGWVQRQAKEQGLEGPPAQVSCCGGRSTLLLQIQQQQKQYQWQQSPQNRLRCATYLDVVTLGLTSLQDAELLQCVTAPEGARGA